MRKVKKHIFTLPPSSFPQAWAAWCGLKYAPVGDRVRQALDFTMDPRTDLTHPGWPWTLGFLFCMLLLTQAPHLLWHLPIPVAAVAPSLRQHIHHQAPHRLPQIQALAHPYSRLLQKTWAVPEAPDGSHDTRLSVDSSSPRLPPQCWLASMTQGASYGSRLSVDFFEARLFAYLAASWVPWQLSWHQAPSEHLWIQAPS